MCLKWVQLFPDYLKVYHALQQTPNLYTVDLDSAIAACSWEIIEMMTKCFGGNTRVNALLETYRKSINYISKYCDEKDMYKNGMIMSIIN
jgi:hypothetical protein